MYLIPKSNFARSLSSNGKSNLDQTWSAMLAKTKLRSRSGIMSFASSSAALAHPIIDGVRPLVIYSIGRLCMVYSSVRIISPPLFRAYVRDRPWAYNTYYMVQLSLGNALKK